MTKRIPAASARLALVSAGLLAFSGCRSSTDDSQITPQQGAVQFMHADYQLAGSKIQFALNDVSAGELSYGQSGSYLPFAVGLQTVKLTAGTTATGTGTIKLDANKLYSYFAGPATATGTISGRFTTDDLTRPVAGRARIRLISLLTNAGNDIELAQPPTSGAAYQHVAYDVEAFSDFAPVTTSLAVLNSAGQVLAQVGSGLGTGTSAKRYEDGHIYTVVVVGDPTAPNTDARPRAYVLTNL